MDTDTATTIARETTAVVAANDIGIDLLHAVVERDDAGRILSVEPAGQEWINVDLTTTDEGDTLAVLAAEVLDSRGWSVVGAWDYNTAHEGGSAQARVERIA